MKAILILLMAILFGLIPSQLLQSADLKTSHAETISVDLADRETAVFLKAKTPLYLERWQEAKVLFEAYLSTYPKGRYRDETFYWLAKCLAGMAQREKELAGTVRCLEGTLARIDLLLSDFPRSLWRNDARALQVEVAAELVVLGQEKYRRYLDEAIKAGEMKEGDAKLIALEALLRLDPRVALPALKELARHADDPIVRREAILLLSRQEPEEAIDVVREAAARDPDPELREQASALLQKLVMMAIPVFVSYYGYEAQLTAKAECVDLPDGLVRSFPLQATAPSKELGVEGRIRRFFREHSCPLALLSFAIRNSSWPESAAFDVAHNLGGFRIDLQPDRLRKGYDRIRGEVLFRGPAGEKPWPVPFDLERNRDLILIGRQGKRLAILVLKFLSREVEVHAGPEPVYPNEFRDILGCSVLSSRGKWSQDELGKLPMVIDFGPARARIPGYAGRWTLIGNLLLDRSQRQFIGRQARLYDEKGKLVAKSREIVVPVDKPAGYTIAER